MVGQGLKDGLINAESRTGSTFGELLSGNRLLVGQLTENMFLQSGTYSTGTAGAVKPVVFTTAFSAAPAVVLTPTQAAGLAPPIADSIVGSAFNASGAIAHSGNYLAWGSR